MKCEICNKNTEKYGYIGHPIHQFVYCVCSKKCANELKKVIVEELKTCIDEVINDPVYIK